MPGIKGMHYRAPRSHSTRRKIWQSMRILRRFTGGDLARTIPEASLTNIRKFIKMLEVHGVVEKSAAYVSGRAGEFQQYRLVVNNGPEYPTLCPRCGGPISAPVCDPSFFSAAAEKKRQKGGTK